MRFYSVFADQTAGGLSALEQAVFVRHGFSWPAFFVFPLWSLYHRLWRPFVLWLILSAAVTGLTSLLSANESWGVVASLAIGLIFAFESGALRRRQMQRQQLSEIGQVSGRSLNECEIIFFTRYLDQTPSPESEPAAPQSPSSTV